MSSYLINTLKDLKEAVKEITGHDRLAHDTETKGPDKFPDISGLYPFHGSRSFSHIIANKKDEYYFNFNVGGVNPKHKIELRPIFENKKTSIFYINAVFDACISHFDGIDIKSRIINVPSIARVEYNNHGRNEFDEKETSFLSLKYLAEYYEVVDKNDAVKKYIKEHELYSSERCRFTNEKIPLYHEVPLELIFPYGCTDVRSTFECGLAVARCINYKDELYEKHRGDMPTMMSTAQREIELTKVVIDMKIRGMKLDTNFTQQAITHEENTAKELRMEVDALTGGINLNSGKQIAEYLENRGVRLATKGPTDNDIKMMNKWYDVAEELEQQIKTQNLRGFRLEAKKKQYANAIAKANERKNGRPITDKKTLIKLMRKYPDLDFLAKITKVKEAEKKLSTYYGNFIRLKDDNDFIHCELNQDTTKTGRFSSSNPNLQNLEKKYVFGD